MSISRRGKIWMGAIGGISLLILLAIGLYLGVSDNAGPSENLTANIPPNSTAPTAIDQMSLAQLKARRAQLLDEWNKEIANYPAYQEMERQNDKTDYDAIAATHAIRWVSEEQKNDPTGEAKYHRLISMYTIHTLAQMIGELFGKEYLLDAYGAGGRYFKDLTAFGIPDEIHKLLPKTDLKALDTPEGFWAAVEKNAAALKFETQKQIRDLPKKLDWPISVVKGLGSEREASVREIVYQNYDYRHIPPKLAALRSEFQAINGRIDALTARQSEP